MTTGRRILGAVLLTFAALVLSIGVAEGALRLLIPAPQVYRMLLPGTREFEPNSRFIHGIHGTARYIVNQNGIRGPEFGADSSEYRILLVGGSTTECAMLDEEENWGWLAGHELATTRDGRKVWLGNVGRSGLTSRDHIVTIKHMLPRYPRMDVVVVLLGVNDLTAALRQGSDYRSPAPLSDPEVEQQQVRNAFALSPGGFRELLTGDEVPEHTPWYRKTKLFQLAKRARVGMQAREVVRASGGSLLGQWRDHRGGASQIIDQLPDLSRPLADYRSSLEAIVREARAGKAEVVFLTQPALWKATQTPAEAKLLWLGGTGKFQEEPGHAYYSTRALAEAMAKYNAETLAVCRAQGLSCLDLATQVPKDSTMFYDDVHFTEAGSALIGRLVAAHLRAVKPAILGAGERP